MTKEDILHHFQDINFYYNDCMMYDDLSRMLDELMAEDKCFDGMTNGEVIQALFPYVKAEDTSFDTLIGTNLDKGYVTLLRDWWNAPYQKGGE